MEEKLEQQPADCLKVVLYGPESTGKTSLAEKLAEHYQTEWVPEFARDYLQEKWDREQKICAPEDLLPIAAGQIQLENELAQKCNRVLICDTNLLETKVYSEAYFNGTCPSLLTKVALNHVYDIYFLTYIDTPWVADNLRDRPDQREEMFARFKSALDEAGKKYAILKGDMETRFKTAVKKIDECLKQRN